MTSPSPVLHRLQPDPYGPIVPRQPKNFRIDSVSVEPIPPRAYLPTGPNTAVPVRFEGHFVLGIPEASVTIEVFVDADLGPVVLNLAIRSNAKDPITTSMLRQVLVDQLLRRATVEATVPASVRTEWLSSLPLTVRETAQETDSSQEQGRIPTANERARTQFEQDVRTAARLWSNAVTSGNRAPGMTVAQEMNRSRAQVARYLRRARELELLPPTANS